MTFIALRRLVCYAYISQYITASCYHSLASGIVVSRRWLSWLIHVNSKRTSTRKCRSALNRNSLSSLSHTANARSVPHRGSSAKLFPSGLRNMIHDPFPMLPIPFYVFQMVSVVIFLITIVTLHFLIIFCFYLYNSITQCSGTFKNSQ